MEEEIKILEKLINLKYDQELLNTLKCVNEDDEVFILSIHEKEAIEKLINKIKLYKYGMTTISEICVDESKCHITSKKAIEEVRKHIIY